MLEIKPKKKYANRKISSVKNNTGTSARLTLPIQALDGLDLNNSSNEVDIFEYDEFLIVSKRDFDISKVKLFKEKEINDILTDIENMKKDLLEIKSILKSNEL